jgi:hypothetical protein
MVGRWAVWPTMSAVAFAVLGVDPLDDILLYIGLAMTLIATAQYAKQVST